MKTYSFLLALLISSVSYAQNVIQCQGVNTGDEYKVQINVDFDHEIFHPPETSTRCSTDPYDGTTECYPYYFRSWVEWPIEIAIVRGDVTILRKASITSENSVDFDFVKRIETDDLLFDLFISGTLNISKQGYTPRFERESDGEFISHNKLYFYYSKGRQVPHYLKCRGLQRAP